MGTNRSQLAVLIQPQEREVGDLGVVSDRGWGGDLWPQVLVQGVHYQPLPRGPISDHLPQFLKDSIWTSVGVAEGRCPGEAQFSILLPTQVPLGSTAQETGYFFAEIPLGQPELVC